MAIFSASPSSPGRAVRPFASETACFCSKKTARRPSIRFVKRADGARPILFAATSPQAKPGAYYGPGGIGELRGAPATALVMPRARDAAAAARLWDISGKLTGTTFE